MIESLRLELAEAQIKLAEMGNLGGSRITELEGKLMETRMTNARLMEENESFQVLLSERTLNGDFTAGGLRSASDDRRTPSREGPGSTSLADELEQSSPRSGDYESEQVRKLELEVTRAKDENKALTLYINKIIERLLQHSGFESVLSNTQDGPHGSGNAAEKALPPVPPSKDASKDEQPEQQSFLQRARSVMSKDGSAKPKRPMSLMPQAPSAHENPATAPSIPLARASNPSGSTNKRMSLPVSTRSVSNSSGTIPGAAGIVSNMYRPPPADQISPSLASPSRSGSFFALTGSNATTTPANVPSPQRLPSGSAITTPPEPSIPEEPPSPEARAARDAAMDALTGRPGSSDSNVPSPPRSISSGISAEARLQMREQNVMGGRQMRPLRLVQKNPDTAAAAEEARQKAANRASWFGGVSNFFTKGPAQENQQPQAGTGAEVGGAMGADRKVSWTENPREE
jgi:hypothetical protein